MTKDPDFSDDELETLRNALAADREAIRNVKRILEGFEVTEYRRLPETPEEAEEAEPAPEKPKPATWRGFPLGGPVKKTP